MNSKALVKNLKDKFAWENWKVTCKTQSESIIELPVTNKQCIYGNQWAGYVFEN